ncbi:MAG: Uma2 family endonuclease [Herpetosiphon sp.]|nr:Uma2 family endonuclease [Herpetosiphon sp.]
MVAQPKRTISVQTYFQRDQASDDKLEYYAGIVVTQAGASARHNTIVANIIGHLYSIVQAKGCRIYPSDLRVQAIAQRVYTYPDLTLVCGKPQFLEPSEQTLINPSVILEIMSPSTEMRDRREKLEYYRQIPSLQEYLLIAQHMPYVQRYVRQTPHFWYVHLIDDRATSIRFDMLDYELSLDAIYTNVEF